MEEDFKNLESALQKACSEENKESIADFFNAFLISKVWVIQRKQIYPMSDSPEYPKSFFDILGIKGKDERVFIPIFTKKAYIKEWTGLDLLGRIVSVSHLLTVIPEGWWIVLNPGQQVSKEFSPWEISELSKGRESIQEVVTEHLIDADSEVKEELFTVSDKEYLREKEILKEIGQKFKTIEEISLLKNVITGEEEKPLEEELIILIFFLKDEEISKIKSLIDKHFIGCAPYKVYFIEEGKREFWKDLYPSSMVYKVKKEGCA